jgi:signal transduction histidine kinase
VGLSLAWNLLNHHNSVLEFAKVEAQANIRKDLAFRLWATSHGGVYVPPDEKTPPNPYLAHVPGRDIVTTDGKPLTLMNPAYMLRQLMQDFAAFGIEGHITSLHPLNPANAPDSWERSAMQSFDAGAKEAVAEETFDGKHYLRMMLPMTMEQGCMRCHAATGVKVGEARGGISASVPLERFEAAATRMGQAITLSHVAAWLIGLGVIASIARAVRRHEAERELVANELRKSRDELEDKVRDRTADLETVNKSLLAEKARQEELIKKLAETHCQLLQSEKLASIGQLAAGVAHEINNPIGYVNSNLGTLQDYTVDLFKALSAYEQREAEMTAATQAALADLKRQIDIDFLRNDVSKLLSESMEGLQRVKSIVQDLKDFSRVNETTKQWANLEKGLDSTINVVWNELKYKAEVVKKYGGVPEIECMPSQLNQVFMNLLINAVQAIEDHGHITLRTGHDGENVWVEVEDDGNGIRPEDLGRIFDPFFTTKPVGAGTGLGLSLSYGIVQQHGGRIEVESNVGKGSLFRVVLPRHAGTGSKAQSH